MNKQKAKALVAIVILVLIAIVVVWVTIGSTLVGVVLLFTEYDRAVETGDASYCYNLEYKTGFDCMVDMVQRHGKSVCEPLPEVRENSLRYVCFAAAARKENDYAVCYHASPYEDEKGECIALVGLDIGNPDICEEIVGEGREFVKGWCYMSMAWRTQIGQEPKDTSLCELIPRQEGNRPFASRMGEGENPRDWCYWHLGDCDKIERAAIKPRC